MSRSDIESQLPTSDPDEQTYRQHCVSCHGNDGRGNNQTTGANFTLQTGVLTQPDDVLLASIRAGKRGQIGLMPAHGGLLDDAHLIGVLGYVRRSFGQGIVPVVDAGVAEDASDAQAP